jgi:hypothetical protein
MLIGLPLEDIKEKTFKRSSTQDKKQGHNVQEVLLKGESILQCRKQEHSEE